MDRNVPIYQTIHYNWWYQVDTRNLNHICLNNLFKLTLRLRLRLGLSLGKGKNIIMSLF